MVAMTASVSGGHINPAVTFSAVITGRSSDVTIRGNDIHDIRSDALDFAQVERVLIEANHIGVDRGTTGQPPIIRRGRPGS